MKRILFILVLFVCTGLSAQQYIFNGTVYVPKTTAQINAISSPQEGRQEYNSTTGTMWVYNGSSWFDTGTGGSGSFLIPVTQAEYDLLTPTEIEENDYAIVDEDDGSGSGGSGIQSVVAGTNISVDNTDPNNPVVSAPDVAVKSFDSGTTGVDLIGNGSGTYTTFSTSWRWFRTGDQVFFFIDFINIDGTDPTGTLQVDISSSSMPEMDSNGVTIFQTYITEWPSSTIYSAITTVELATRMAIRINTGASNTNASPVINMDFSGTTDIHISGVYKATN